MQLPLLYLFERLGFPVFNDPDDQKASFLSLEGIRFGEDDADKPGILYLSGYESGTGYHLTDVHSPASVSGTLPDADAQRVLNASLDEWDAFRKASEQIGLLRAEGADLQAYIPLFSKLMGNPVYIVDASYKVIAIDTDPVYPEMSAIWRFLVTNRYLSYDIIKELKLTREMQSLTRKDHARLVTQSAVFPNSFINAPLFSGDQLIGHVFIVGYNTALTPGRIALAEQIRQFIQDLLQKDSHFTVSNIRGYENFLLHLLTGTLSDPTVIRKQCRALSWNEEGNFLAAVLQTGESDSIRNEGLCRKIEQLTDGHPLIYEESIIVFYDSVSTKSQETIFRQLRRLARSEHCPTGLSDVFHKISEIRTYYLQAAYASKHTSESSGSFFASYGETAIEQLLQLTKEDLPAYFTDPLIPELKKYDSAHGTEYLKTLKVFLEKERNITDTSAELGIHRNTLLYRIDRILHLFPRDLDLPSVRMRILLSMLIGDKKA